MIEVLSRLIKIWRTVCTVQLIQFDCPDMAFVVYKDLPSSKNLMSLADCAIACLTICIFQWLTVGVTDVE